MTLKRLVLILLTVGAVVLLSLSLINSWQEPQIQSRLELYQTNILLQASQWQPQEKDTSLQAAREAVVGDKPLETATEQYQKVRSSAQINLDKAKNQLAKISSAPQTTPTTPKRQPETPSVTTNSRLVQKRQVQLSYKQLQKLMAELDLNLGILQVQQKQTDTALKTWQNLQQNSNINSAFTETATVLSGLWSNPPRIEPDAQKLIETNLDGWFRDRALSRLYELQQRPDELAKLKAAEQETAQQALFNLAIIATIPAVGGLIGFGLLIFLMAQRLIKGKQSLLARNGDQPWTTPWDGETILWVFVVGFFCMGQIFVPILLGMLPINRVDASVRVQSVYVLISYLLVAFGSLAVLYVTIKRFFPLPEGWFRFRLQGKWWLWGIGGYWVALPLVVIVSLLNQQIWQGQGGSNPLLELALTAQDNVALGIFFLTAAIAAPLFEEFLFRGFLLPSLTRYFPVSGAIIVSSLLFAAAHLSLSEVLPLTTLGIVLGIVYTRSRNLLAPMLLHSLWNSGTLLSLFILGNSAN